MTEPMSPTGFWSYTRDDDNASDGRLSRLRVILTKELQVQLGRAAKVRIFQDVETIPTGADWDHEIGKALSQSTFFIPIVTPGFVQSRMCCLELMRFRDHEAARGRNDLIFPLHYIDTKHLDPDRAGDCHDPEALRLLRARQMFEFDGLRFRDPGREDVLVRISALAIAIRDALRRDPPDPKVVGLSLTGGAGVAEQARREAAEARRRLEAEQAEAAEQARRDALEAQRRQEAAEAQRRLEAEQAELAARLEAEQREAARIAEEQLRRQAAAEEQAERDAMEAQRRLEAAQAVDAAGVAEEARVARDAAAARDAQAILSAMEQGGKAAVAPPVRRGPPVGARWGIASVAAVALSVGAYLSWPPTPKPPEPDRPRVPVATTPPDPVASGPAATATVPVTSPPSSTPAVPATPAPPPAGTPAKSAEPQRQFPAPAFDNGKRDCPTCPPLVLLPAGQFRMGVPPEESAREDAAAGGNFYKDWDKNAKPHPVTIRRPLYMGETPVTVGEYSACVKARACEAADKPSFAQDDRHPQVGVSYVDATKYVAWLNKPFNDDRYRLPSEAEWEYGARAVTSLSEPSAARYWGEAFDAKATLAIPTTGTVPVKGYTPNNFGLYDMLGHVWQWTTDCWIDNYDNGEPATEAARTTTIGCASRVLRGGSWYFYPGFARAGFRVRDDVGGRASWRGFRVARTY